jgi:hypothetical protein
LSSLADVENLLVDVVVKNLAACGLFDTSVISLVREISAGYIICSLDGAVHIVQRCDNRWRIQLRYWISQQGLAPKVEMCHVSIIVPDARKNSRVAVFGSD